MEGMNIRKEIPHPQLKKFVGKECVIKIGKREYEATPYFIGRNSAGHDVITTENRGIHYINSWKRVSIQTTK